jgi:ATP-binding cassette subfamily B protein
MDPLLHNDSSGEPFQRRAIAPGEVIFVEGQQADAAFVILKGEVEAGSFGGHDNFIVLSRMKAGEMFGEIALLTPDGKRTASTMSAGGCELLVIPREVFDRRLKKTDPLMHFVIDHLCRRLIRLTGKAVEAELDDSRFPKA